jgi:outer membrane protein assembly factor BamB
MSPAVSGSPSVGATVVWRSDAILDFPNSFVGDLELIAGNLITLTGEGTTITGTRIIAIDPASGRTSWADSSLNDLVPAGASSYHHAHFLRDGDDLILLVTDGSLQKSALVRFSTTARRAIWKYTVDQILFPESLSVHNSMTCFAGERPSYARFVACLDRNGKRLWTQDLEQSGAAWTDTEIAITASRLMVLEYSDYDPGHALASVFDLQTGARTVPTLQVNATSGGFSTRRVATWNDDRIVAFLAEGITVFDLSSPQRQPQLLISLSGQFPRAPEVAVAGSTVYLMYDLPYPNGGDHPKSDVVAAFDLGTGKKLWQKTDLTDPNFERARPMRLQGSYVLYGAHDGGVWMLAASTGVVQRHLLPSQSPLTLIDRVAPLQYGKSLIVSENLGPGPTDFRLAAIQ